MAGDGLPAALVDNAVVNVTHPHQCRDLVSRLCPLLPPLPEARVHTPPAQPDRTRVYTPPAQPDRTHTEEQTYAEEDESSSLGPTENSEEFRQDHLNLFLERGAVSADHTMSWEKLYVLFCEEGWEKGVNALKDRYASSTWRIFLLDLLLWLSSCIQSVAGCLLWWFSEERKTQLEAIAIENFAQRKNWPRLNIKLLKWHPTMVWACQHTLALVTSDNVVHVYFSGRNDPTVLNGLSEGGNCVLCLDWRPYSLTLILGCRDAIHIFCLTPRGRYPSSHTTLPQPCVTALCPSPHSLHLAAVSIASATLVLWDLTDSSRRPVQQFNHFSSPNYLVRWSHSGLHLAVGTTGVSFKFYTLLDSSCNKWSVPRGYVTSLAWSPDDRYVLFASSEDSYVHFIQYASVTGIEDKRATPLVDTSTMIPDDFETSESVNKNRDFQKTEDNQKNDSLNDEQSLRSEEGNDYVECNGMAQKDGEDNNGVEDDLYEEIMVNGDQKARKGCPNVAQSSRNLIQSLVLDSEGQNLAVSFRHLPVIALYKLHIGLNIEVWAQHRLPIWPEFGPLACMDFLTSSDCPGKPIVLTLAWNSGVVQHFPIL